MDTIDALRPLLAAEAAAEAAAADTDPEDLEQDVWVRLLSQSPPEDRAAWVRRAVRTEARAARRRARREIPYDRFEDAEPRTEGESGPEPRAIDVDDRLRLRRAVSRLPGRCPELLAALLAPGEPTYREIAGELGMSQGSLGPVRSRCLGCLRRLLAAEVGPVERWGKQP
ncbi:sigma-70 family RNA polymerase sigma factor [Streptomyces sp. NPDC060194]|uniref:sigma-70 family RNA polymerase sigma factor n=1 Tax=Streptomyces sp. NPDC060194 TaxID=3347069 RepID=UPI00365498E2